VPDDTQPHQQGEGVPNGEIAVDGIDQEVEQSAQDPSNEEDKNVPDHPFWIAKVTAVDIERNELELLYYKRGKADRKFVPDKAKSHGRCAFDAVLLYGFELTTTSILRSVTYNQLVRVLDL